MKVCRSIVVSVFLLAMLSLNQALRLPFTIPTLPAAKPIAPALALALTLGVQSASAISGGGLDYANLNLSESQDFAGKSFSKKDFSQIIAKNTNFHDSTLIGCRFYKAYLVGTDFSGADITGAALEDTSMDDANLNDAVAVGSYFSASLLDVKSVEGTDFTDASIPDKTRIALCKRDDVKGKNSKTGVETRDSLMCLD
ncbi:hypothetical protein TrLO_g7323 [Triparma laevis f. longispina]|uniref:Pentapeptide repeat-containing protein n=1 Tax=Triparma laevis f. longispina TaxID=1714387 RepID=A0A9W7DN67_9STRA|nr:hypothetical protein TrLO_g7323 [Triparma laevis f. longispina]